MYGDSPDILKFTTTKKTGTYWYNELHPTDQVFAEIANLYIAIIDKDIPEGKRVFSVIDYFDKQSR